MKLPFRRRADRDARAEARRVRRVERALHQQEAGAAIESENARADLDNASLRISGMNRGGPAGLIAGGGGGGLLRRRGPRETLRDEGYDGD